MSGGIVGLLVVCALTGCSKGATENVIPRSVLHCSVSTNTFELSAVSSTRGSASPIAAAVAASQKEVAGNPNWHVPSSGWVVVQRGSGTASVRSGLVQLHVVQGADESWRVDSGYRCLHPVIGPSHSG